MPWVSIHDVRYDITDFLHKHPGGAELLLSFDKLDATDVFAAFHSSNAAKSLLKTLPVIQDPQDMNKQTRTEVSNFEVEMRALHHEFETKGLYIANEIYYFCKLVELGAILSFGTWFMTRGWWWTSMGVISLFFQQAGWLAHDFAHNQVIRKYRPFFIMLVGNVSQGFSGVWWIHKHMMHHARPNALHEDSGQPVEEDFDTAPVLYWTEKLLPKTKRNWLSNVWTKYQGIMLWLVLPFSKFFWDLGSIRVAWKRKVWWELYGIGLHYALFAAFAIQYNKTLLGAAWYFVITRMWAGFLTAWVFIQSHNGMEYYQRPEYGFYESQIRSTRNMSLDTFSTWFTGGLNYQIEHHLFPRMPRHNLPYVAKTVQTVCERNGLKYEIMDIWKCSWWLTKYLNNIHKKQTSHT